MKYFIGYNLALLLMVSSTYVQASQEIKLIRDSWGIPHVFAETDEDAFFGLGYATAEDRAFQMTYTLRTVQGRLAEVIGEVRYLNRAETAVDHDRKMRTFGFYRQAIETAKNLDQPTRDLLQAYSDGVNRYFEENAHNLHPLFAHFELEPEPWTPADCIACWWRLGQFFGTDGTRDLIAGRNLGRQDRGRGNDVPPADLQALPPDDQTAVVRKSDLSPAWIEEVHQFDLKYGVRSSNLNGDANPTMSHAWVVSGQRTTTGSSVLVSDPQTPVRNPSLLYEFHIRGKSFNVRGVGVAGSPIILIGFSEQVAWGATALGADQADLFLLETDPDRPNQYRFDGQWRPMSVIEETIKVKGQPSIPVVVRQTHLGVVATEFCFAQAGDPEVALKRVPTCETDRDTIQAALSMMRAADVYEFDAALADWRFPSANLIFGDRDGNIGYRAVGAIPMRSKFDTSQGRIAQPGHRSDQDWQTVIPSHLMPGVINPADGILFSGNHRTIESWYPLSLGMMTGSGGDTLRSWRLRELLQQPENFTPEDVLQIHFDAVNPARRDLVSLGLHLRDVQKVEMSAEAQATLLHLTPWLEKGASTSLDQPGSELVLELDTFFRFVNTDLAYIYGGGESGLAYFLKKCRSRLSENPQSELDARERKFIQQALTEAWHSATEKYGSDPQLWNQKAQAAITQQTLAYYQSLDGFPGLDRNQDIALPPLRRTDPGTIGCQTAQTYTQWVSLHDPDSAMTILPIGQSERPDHNSRFGTLELWRDSLFHPAPLSREKVKAIGVSTLIIKR